MHFKAGAMAVVAAGVLSRMPAALAAEDCDIAGRLMPFATVDCQYTWAHGGGDNFLNYVGKSELDHRPGSPETMNSKRTRIHINQFD